MDDVTARGVVEQAAEAWWLEEGTSLPDGVNERAVTHRLAVYLERKIRALDPRVLAVDGLGPAELHVDCEYNRHGLDPKRVREVAEQVAHGVREWPSDTGDHTVFPDVIVHRRGEAGPNLIAIEAKRRGSPRRAVAWDEKKLRLYRESPLHYQHTFLLLYGGKTRPEVKPFPPTIP
jgi:hypothetical protein